MSKKGSTGGKVGTGLLALGIAGVLWTNVISDFSPEALCRLAVVVGVIVVYGERLVARTEAGAQQYRLGYDIGHEDGFQEGHGTAKPVVVDLDLHRNGCDRCKGKAISSDLKVADRV